MKIKIKKLTVFSAVTGLVTILFVNIYSFPSGYTGVTKKGDGLGCICHGTNQPTPSVSVFFEGPDSVATGGSALYKIKISHGPAIVGGFDAAVFAGTIDTTSSDTTLWRDNLSGDLSHRFPKEFVNDTLFWTFKYTAPTTALTDTLYAVGNSCNNDTSSSNDEWNFSPNFVIRVFNPIGIVNSGLVVKEYKLYQNYPNPFNPVTKIRFYLKESGNMNFAVFDITGSLVKILHSGFAERGFHALEFEAGSLASGVYFYRLETQDYTDTKTMVLVK